MFNDKEIAEIVGLKVEELKTPNDYRSAFYDVRLNPYLKDHEDLRREFSIELLNDIYCLLKKQEGKFRDYEFLADYALEYGQQDIYIFALDNAFKKATNLEQLAIVRQRHDHAITLRIEKRPMGHDESLPPREYYYGFWEGMRIRWNKFWGVEMWQKEDYRIEWKG